MPGLVPQVTCGEISPASMIDLACRTRRRRRCAARASARSPCRAPRPAARRGARLSVNHAKVVSSGAIMPARPPPSIVMLQTVMRPSIDSASIAGAGVLDDVAGHAADAEPPERAEDQVLGGDAEAELALVEDAHRARLVLDHALRREHVLDLARADAEGERAEGAVRGGVRVAADDRHAGLRDAELGADHVHDALALGAERVDGHAELGAVALERFHLHARELVLDLGRDRGAVGRRVVVGRRQRAVGAAHRRARPCAGCRRPAGWSPRARGAGRCRAGRGATSCVSQILSNSVCGIVIGPSRRRRRLPAASEPAETTARNAASSSAGFSKWCGRSASNVTQSPSRQLVALAVADEHRRCRARRAPSRGCRARASAGRRPRRWRRRARACGARAPRAGRAAPAVSTSKRCPRRALPPRWRWAARTIVTAPPSSRRSSCDRRSSRPAAMRAATVSVGLVSPRSTCESIGALTPLRAARSRSERSADSRSALTRAPTAAGSSALISPAAHCAHGC